MEYVIEILNKIYPFQTYAIFVYFYFYENENKSSSPFGGPVVDRQKTKFGPSTLATISHRTRAFIMFS